MNLKLHFPHPVLSVERDDYQESIFVNECQLLDESINKKKYIFQSKINNTNNELKKLVEDGKVAYSIRVECPRTHFSKSFNFTTSQNSFVIDPNEVDGLIKISTFIVASSNIKEFYSEDFHEDFRDMKFNIQLGEILGAHKTGYLIDEKQQEQEDSVKSIFIFRKDNEFASKGFNYDLNDRIIIYLNEENYNRLSQLQQGVEGAFKILHSMYAVPVLTSILNDIEYLGDEFIDEQLSRKWMVSLLKQFEKMGITRETLQDMIREETPISLAQELVEFPMKKSLLLIESIANSEEE